MKVASVVAAVLLLCIAFPGSIHAKFQKPKYCVGKDGKHYLRGEHYEDKKGEKCIRYTCVRKGKKLEMNKKKISCDEPPTNMTANVTALEASFKSLQTSVLSLQTSVESILEMVTALQSRSSQLETNVTINIDAIKYDISTNVATLATKCDASTCASLQITATDIESCLADITSSTCPPPPSGKTGVAGGISANTAALADKCDASNCSDIQTTVENLERNVTTNKDTINIIKDDISTNVASLATKCDASSCTSLQTSATDIESCLADITSSACPPPSNGKTSMAGGISGNTAALADKCDASTCSDIQTTVGNLETNVTTNIDAININKNDISTKVASLAQGIANNTAALADKCDASTCSDIQTTVENLETNVKTNKATININKDDISTNVASLATKCNASSCTSLQTSATDIESCLADITSSACPPPPSGKTSVAEGIANNTAALDHKCDASTCKDIENMVLNLGLSTAATIKATTTTKAPTGSSTAATIKATTTTTTTTKAPTELIDGTCYEDDITNLLDERHESNTNTPDECIGTCASRGYSYAGLRYSTDCFCGNDEPPASRIRPSSQCNMKCSGDASLICGGFWRTNIYNTVKTGTCEVSECFSAEGCPLIKNKLLTTLPELNKEFFMSFEHLKAPQSASGNVIHLTEGGDCCDVGRRIPAVYTWPEGQLGFRFAINGDGSHLVLKTATKYPANQWTRVQISQTQKNNKFMFRIIINGINMKEIENEQPKKFSDVKVYVSSPWHNSLGSIRNLFINARGSSKCNGGSSTAATIKATTTTTKAPTDWTIIQRRGQYGNAVDYFYKDFKDYEDGFGSVDDELWIGLKKLAALTKDGEWELQVDLTDWDDKKYHAKYDSFSVGPAPTYKLHVGGFKDGESTLGDSMDYHDGQAFSARDMDQDTWGSSCAVSLPGGWWYKSCHNANLNGLNFAEQKIDGKCLSWLHGKSRGNNRFKSWKASVMKIKRGLSTATTIKATTTTKAPTVPKFEAGGIAYCFSACNTGILNAAPNGDSDGAITLGGYACSEQEGGLFSKNFVGVGKAIKLPQSVKVGSLPVGPKTFAILLKHGQDYVHGQRVPREIIQRNSFILNSEPWPAARAEVNGCITQTFPDVFSKTEFVLVVVTVDEEDITVYRNGVKLGSKRCNRVPRANDEPLYLGNNHMSGTIKSFAVWNRALNQNQVESIDSTQLTCKGSSTETTTTTMTTTTTTKAQTVLWIAGKNDKTIETLKLPDFTPVNASCKVPNPNMDLLDSNIQEIQGKLYSCDHRLCQTYSAEDNTWTTIPGKRFKFQRQWAAGTVIGDKWIVQGGYVWENGKWINVKTAEVWSPGTGNWVEAPQYKSPLPVHGYCVVNINGKIMQIGGYSYALGGAGTDKCFVDGGEVASLTAPRRSHSCAVFHGEVWVAGGRRTDKDNDDKDKDARVVEIYDPQSNSWAEGAKLPGEIKLDIQPLLLNHEGNLYYVGGQQISKIYQLNIDQSKWEEVGDIAKEKKWGHIVNTKVC